MSMIFPISKSCHKIIDYVFKSNGVKISKLLRETSVSQKIGYAHIKELVSNNILIEESVGSLRIIKPYLKSETGRLIFGLIEKQRELELINHKPMIEDSLRVIKSESSNLGIESVVLFGSFIKDYGDSKIDILVISESNDKRIIPFLQKSFNSVENAVSARIMNRNSFSRFRSNKKDLFNSLFSNHICVFNTQLFLGLIA